MKIILVISAFFLISFSGGVIKYYDKLFPEDYSAALNFVTTNYSKFKSIALKYKHNPVFTTAIVFPEIMRYSVLQDFIETSALEIAYTNYGSSVADFSIGRFQMKPSFVESLEHEIDKNDSLSEIFSEIIFKSHISELEKRKTRLQHLQNINWQIIYLNAFITICDIRFKELDFESTTDKLLFYATAYNAGFYNKPNAIRIKATQPYFPYGPKYKGTQYVYGDISTYYYTKLNK